MSPRGSQILSATSCLAAVSAGLLYASLVGLKEPHLSLIFVLFGLGVLGLISGLAGLISLHGRDRILSIVGFLLSMPTAFIGLTLVAAIFGQRH
jgi:hypothetical protein